MTRPWPAAFAFLASAAAGAATEGPPWRFGGETFAGFAIEELHDVAIHAFDLRIGFGGRQAGQRIFGVEDVELGALVTAGGQFGSTAHGLPAKEGRLGLALRLRVGRLTGGLDAEGILLTVTRRSTSGNLLGTGLAVRAVLDLDLLQFQASALYLGVEGSLAAIGSSDDRYLPAAQAGLGVRW